MAVRSKQATRELEPPIPSVVTYLLAKLGDRLTAVIADVRDTACVRDWAAGDLAPEPAIERRLRTAFEVTQMILEVDSAETARLWFRGMNPELDDAAPALMIATAPEHVLAAARFFVANG